MIVVRLGKNLNGNDIEAKFQKHTGRSVGNDEWSHQYLMQETPELREKYETFSLINKAIKLRQTFCIPNDRATLEKLIKALEPFCGKPEIEKKQ